MSAFLQRALRSARNHGFTGLDAIGALRAVGATPWRRRRLLILCYHGVAMHDEHEWDPMLFVTPVFLQRRFEILREEGCTVLPLGEGLRRLEEESLPPRSVAITFDDGFYNFPHVAVPLLEHFGYPATNYVSTYYCERQLPIPRLALRYILWRARALRLPAELLEGGGRNIPLVTEAAREAAAARLLDDRVVAQGGEAQHDVIVRVAQALGVGRDCLDQRLFHLMTQAEVEETSRRGVDIQLHTHRHRTPRGRDLFCREIAENRQRLEAWTGKAAVHFCYPSGDVDARFLPWLREMGVVSATTGSGGLAAPGDETLLLPRYVDTMLKSETQFKAWLSGVGALLTPRRT